MSFNQFNGILAIYSDMDNLQNLFFYSLASHSQSFQMPNSKTLIYACGCIKLTLHIPTVVQYNEHASEITIIDTYNRLYIGYIAGLVCSCC